MFHGLSDAPPAAESGVLSPPARRVEMFKTCQDDIKALAGGEPQGDAARLLEGTQLVIDEQGHVERAEASLRALASRAGLKAWLEGQAWDLWSLTDRIEIAYRQAPTLDGEPIADPGLPTRGVRLEKAGLSAFFHFGGAEVAAVPVKGDPLPDPVRPRARMAPAALASIDSGLDLDQLPGKRMPGLPSFPSATSQDTLASPLSRPGTVPPRPVPPTPVECGPSQSGAHFSSYLAERASPTQAVPPASPVL